MLMETLNDLEYSEDRKGPFQLYLYDGDGHHSGGTWFRNQPRYSDEISTGEALARVELALEENREVRICDRGDLLVYHARNGKVLYPNDPDNFWEQIAA